MGFESAKLFRLLRLEYTANAAVNVRLYTDLPGEQLAIRETLTLPAAAIRRVYKFRLSGTTKGQLWKVRITPLGTLSLFGGALYVRKLGRTASDWTWVALPITPTADGYVDLKLPIEPTPDNFSTLELPIERTPDNFSTLELPIEKTPDGYADVRIPMRPSPDEVASIELPMDE